MRIQVNRQIFIFLYSFFSGACLTLAFAPYSNFFYVVFCIPALLHLIAMLNSGGIMTWQTFWLGFSFGFGNFLFSLNWVMSSFDLVFPHGVGLSVVKSLLTCLMASSLAAFTGLALLFSELCLDRRNRSLKAALPIEEYRVFATENRALFLSVFYMLFEYLRSYALLPFPWLLLSHSLVFSDHAIQLFRYFSPHFLTFIVFLFASTFFVLSKRFLALSLFLFVITASYGASRISRGAKKLSDTAPEIFLIQTNMREVYLTEEERYNSLRRTVEISQSALKMTKEDSLIVWPESGLKYLFKGEEKRLNFIYSSLSAEFVSGLSFLIGADTISEYNIYNSMLHLDKMGSVNAIYHKRRLVPFGEYIPFNAVLGFFMREGVVGGSFSSGISLSPAEMAYGGLNIRPYICYDAIFPEYGAGERDRSATDNIAIQISNDIWFGNSIGQDQHIAALRIKAVELDSYLLRASNGGSSAVIDSLGRVIAKLPLSSEGIIQFGSELKLVDLSSE